MKKYTTNTEVVLKHTGDKGIIIDILPDGMVMVELEDGDDIPVFMDELISADEAFLLRDQAKRASIQKAETTQETAKDVLSPSLKKQIIAQSLGIQLGFETQANLDGTPIAYKIHLINDTAYDALYSFQLSTKRERGSQKHSKIDSCTSEVIQSVSHDALNDDISILVECWQLTTLGTGSKLSKEIKIKPKQFFKKQRLAPILDHTVYHYILFDNFEKKKTKKVEDLKAYTQRKSQELPKKKKKKTYYRKNDVNAFANFQNELDLHIENLAPNHARMSNQEIIHIQLDAFDKYLSRALELGVSPIYVIHGVGKGRLKSKIAERLRSSFYVKKFKNEFHPKYGFGATEIHI